MDNVRQESGAYLQILSFTFFFFLYSIDAEIIQPIKCHYWLAESCLIYYPTLRRNGFTIMEFSVILWKAIPRVLINFQFKCTTHEQSLKRFSRLQKSLTGAPFSCPMYFKREIVRRINPRYSARAIHNAVDYERAFRSLDENSSQPGMH